MEVKPLTLMCAQPCNSYYAWQLEVMLTNFTSFIIEGYYEIHILCAYDKNESDWETKKSLVEKVEKKFLNKAKFFYYQDTRQFKANYLPSIRPNILKQHFTENRSIISDAIFYHDCDMIFTKFPIFLQKYINGNEWYVSDTRSYIGYDYIIQHGEDILDLMTAIVNIDKQLVKRNQYQSGGAQYVMKGVTPDFFERVEKDCENLFTHVSILNMVKEKQDENYNPIQIWCADMWAMLWNAWKDGHKANIPADMNFCVSTDSIDKWKDCQIFHNAGVVDSISDSHFFKSDFRYSLPFLHDGSKYNKYKASYKYFELIKKIGENSCLYEQD